MSSINAIKNKLTDDPHQNIRVILETVLTSLKASIAIYDVVDKGISMIVKSNGNKTFDVVTSSEYDDFYYRSFMDSGNNPVVISNLQQTENCRDDRFVKKFNLNAFLSIPSYFNGELINSISIFDTKEREFSEIEINLLGDYSLLLLYEERHIVDCNNLTNTTQKYSSVFDNSTDGLILLKDEIIIDYNPSVAKVLGADRDEFIGRKFDKLLVKREGEEPFKEVLDEIMKGSSPVIERELQKNNDTRFEAELSCCKIEELDDCNVLIVLRDITKRKAFERGLIAATEKAEESSRLKSVSLASMSHELRTPLNSIIGFSELLLDEDTTEDEKEMFSKLIRTAGKSLMALIGDIVDISKIEAGQITIKKTYFNINSFLQDILVMFKQEKENLDKSDIELRLVLSDKASDIKIESDQHRLQQIFSNLLTNSLKFIDQGFIEFGYLSITPKFIQFYVKDTGVGIDQAKRDKIFEIYGQDKITYNRNKEGTGLGLAISKSFVELLGGRIWVDSELEAGSTFYFTIPVKLDDSHSGKIIGQNSGFGERWPGKTILIADDVKENYLFLKGILDDTAGNILWAKDGEEAVIYCRQQMIDLILMDIRMPVMDGYEAAKIILDESPNTKIIAQTAFANPEDKKYCLDLGFDEYLKKPIDYENLISVISKYLD